MKFLKKLWTGIKSYHYKLITLFVGLVLFSWLAQHCGDNLATVFGVLAWICTGGLAIYMLVAMFYACKNTWNDGDKVLAIVYGTLVVGFVGFVTYLILFVA